MLTRNTLQLLEQVAQYRLTTIDAVHAFFYAEKSREAARVALYRVAKQGLLLRFEIRNRSFYQLSKMGCAQVGVPRNASQPFTSQTLIERYAILCFSVLRPGNRHRIEAKELAEVFPEVRGAKRIDPTLQHYYIDREGGALRLGRVTVDNGGDIAHLVYKCRAIADETARGALKDLVNARAFVLTVLTAYETKSARLQEVLKKQPLVLPVRVEVIPEIKHLL